MRLVILIFCLLFSAPWRAASGASWITGNELKQSCDGVETPWLCIGYVLGASDYATLNALDAVTKKPVAPENFCIPKEATRAQAVAVVRKYLREHPEQLHWDAAGLVHNALLEAFPCR